MKTGRFLRLFAPLALVLTVITGVSASAPGGTQSIGNSYVYHPTTLGDDVCSISGLSQTFCFQAISYTTDYDWVYDLWLRFPDGWNVSNAYVQDTPYCTSGGTFGAMTWWGPAANEIRIEHPRYQANPSDACSANYCVDVTPTLGADTNYVSWYWQSSLFGSPPYYPCSSDGYTPAGLPACDESITPPAYIDSCPRVFLPSVLKP